VSSPQHLAARCPCQPVILKNAARARPCPQIGKSEPKNT
jgi:hypothetical protein